ncbi:MAG: glutamine--fructose-6-phosphate aminotransferase, partial [Candidatus Methylomirabilales bacterium]
MCGIVGYIGPRQAATVLLPALQRLEYRGYDSAGIATVNGETLDVRKAVGKIVRLESLLTTDPPHGCVGIAHTRWATHGRPSDANAHPHVDCGSRLAIVHNGIIENYRELRKDLAREGHRFRSETDTEVIAHLIERHRANGLSEAVLRAAQELRGAYALVCIAGDAPDMLVAVRSGSSPLVIGVGDGEVFLASDIPAILGETKEVLILEEGEQALLTPEKITVRTLDGAPVSRAVTTIPWEREAAEKGGY